ncbi:MAG: hypothetical protein ISEC1_P1966 [Thiomicrorhabdus sp.]|nr:MAG: hypothetical protein ISEC1_P1966 [Thiomicrorhabdus sp.]
MALQSKKVLKGQLKRWNEAKGFGFINAGDEERDIFIHISDLKGMSRRPVVGDTIHYQIMVQDDGKNRAINAKIDGVKKVKAKGAHNQSTISNTAGILISTAFITLLVIIALF